MEHLFSDTARSERHFSAMLLPHLLLANDYAGMRALFGCIESFGSVNLDSDDIEFVAELNPIRDVGESSDNSRIKRSVPDLCLRIDTSVLVIEAKFFTFPTAELVVEQMEAQREAIRSVLQDNHYQRCTFHYLALTAHELSDFPTSETCMSHLTWDQIIEMIEPSLIETESRPTNQVLKGLKCAVDRAKAARRQSGVIDYERCNTIRELLGRAPEFLEKGYLYVGFDGGIEALHESSVNELEKRHHYKYSLERWSNNWLPMEMVLAHYLEKKAEDSKSRVNT